ncbi:MAG: hypothetical protein ACE5RP_00070 [Nitrosopumilus sp.]
MVRTDILTIEDERYLSSCVEEGVLSNEDLNKILLARNHNQLISTLRQIFNITSDNAYKLYWLMTESTEKTYNSNKIDCFDGDEIFFIRSLISQGGVEKKKELMKFFETPHFFDNASDELKRKGLIAHFGIYKQIQIYIIDFRMIKRFEE